MRLADDGRRAISVSMYLNGQEIRRKELVDILGKQYVVELQKSFRESCLNYNAPKGFSLQYPTNIGVLTIKLERYM